MLTEETADRYVLIAAGAVIIVLTGSGFWLSYAHLAEVAGQHGLGRSPIRQWAWPATLDAFIVAGELLMLRAGLRRVTDWWAIALTGVGSLGSIALNVAGVSGTNDGPVPPLDYVVAAVPPTGAMLAFGVLMRQIHQRLIGPVSHSITNAKGLPEVNEQTAPGPDQDLELGPDPNPEPGPDPDHQRTEPEPGPDPDHQQTAPEPDQDLELGPAPHPEPGPDQKSGAERQRTAKRETGRRRRPRPGPDRLSQDEVFDLVLPHIPAVLMKDGNRRVTRAQLRSVMRAHGITLGNEHLGPVLDRVRAATTPNAMEGAPR
ncbi:DUF2637 domain-containing protein [Streptomyces sp. S1]|uniref:DUF2637 domain-containing protein n=1 Tax=Streptomyces sp. S1 TaxID=718288 RepID=UPI003D758249